MLGNGLYLRSTEQYSSESLFEYFFSQVEAAGLVTISVRGIPEGVNRQRLVADIIGESLGTGRSLAFAHKAYYDNAVQFGEGYRQQYAAVDRNFIHSIEGNESFLYDFSRAPEGSKAFYCQYGIGTTLVIPVLTARCKGWKLRLVLHSVLTNEELSRFMAVAGKAFWNEVRHLCLELMEQFEPVLKPINGDEMGIHPHGRRVIELLAEGYSTKAIASVLRLTEKGVDYHLTVLREKLQARNRTHLVSQAYRKGIL